MNPFLYKELRALSPGRALINNLVLLAVAVGTKSMSFTLAAFFFLYSACIRTALANDGLGNIYIFLAGKRIDAVTRERVGARLAVLCLQTVPAMAAALVLWFTSFIPGLVLITTLAYANGLFFAVLVYRRGAARAAAGLVQAAVLVLCGFALFFPFQEPAWKLIIVLCLIPVDYFAAAGFLKEVALEDIITAKGR